MLVTEVYEALPGGASLLRNEPVQARSSARLTGLLDAAAVLIDEVGVERLTTAMVAERAGASIGTVYRYFPDRIAIVEALAVRSVQRLIDRIDDLLESAAISEWSDAIDVVVDAYVIMYRNEPGFRTITFADTENAQRTSDIGEPPTPSTSERLTTFLTNRIPLPQTPTLPFVLDVISGIAAALIGRAFVSEPSGDERFVAECRLILACYLEKALPSQA